MCIAVFDTVVNMGAKGLNWILDRMTTDDNVTEFCQLRIARYKSFKNKTYERGWINRVNDLRKYIELIEDEGEESA